MKNLPSFEQFLTERKEYGQKITNKEFEDIETGSIVLYMGSRYTVGSNDGFVLKLEPTKGGSSIEVNYSMFNKKGAILESELDESERKSILTLHNTESDTWRSIELLQIAQKHIGIKGTNDVWKAIKANSFRSQKDLINRIVSLIDGDKWKKVYLEQINSYIVNK